MPQREGPLDRGGGICCAEEGLVSSTGDSVKLASKLGVEAHDRPFVATLPKRKAGRGTSDVYASCGICVVESALTRDKEGRVAARLRLNRVR